MNSILDVIPISEMITTVISIVAAVGLVYFGERITHRYRLSKGKEPRDQASCAHHILQALDRHETPRSSRYITTHSENQSAMTWENIAIEATELISNVTEGGNYRASFRSSPPKKHTHMAHMKEARKNLLDLKLIARYAHHRERGDSIQASLAQEEHRRYKLTELGRRLINRVGQYTSKDERDAVFEDFYNHGKFPVPPLGKAHGHHHHEYLDHLLPRGRNGHIGLRADGENDICYLFRLEMSPTSESKHEGALPTIKWACVKVNYDASQANTQQIYHKRFKIHPDTFYVELELERVRQLVDMAWQPNELVARLPDYAKFVTHEVATFTSELMPLVLKRAQDTIHSGWLGNHTKLGTNTEVLKALREAFDELGIHDARAKSQAKSSVADATHELAGFRSSDIRCVGWAVLVPRLAPTG